jgi:hypothetical protein
LRTQKGVLASKSDITGATKIIIIIEHKKGFWQIRHYKKNKIDKICLQLHVATISDKNVIEKKAGKNPKHTYLSIQIQGM